MSVIVSVSVLLSLRLIFDSPASTHNSPSSTPGICLRIGYSHSFEQSITLTVHDKQTSSVFSLGRSTTYISSEYFIPITTSSVRIPIPAALYTRRGTSTPTAPLRVQCFAIHTTYYLPDHVLTPAPPRTTGTMPRSGYDLTDALPGSAADDQAARGRARRTGISRPCFPSVTLPYHPAVDSYAGEFTSCPVTGVLNTTYHRRRP